MSKEKAQKQGMMQPNKKHEMQQALLWDLRCLRSGFGNQTRQIHRTEPATPFGRAAKDTYHKVGFLTAVLV
jgi:hypothetical protein